MSPSSFEITPVARAFMGVASPYTSLPAPSVPGGVPAVTSTAMVPASPSGPTFAAIPGASGSGLLVQSIAEDVV
jgi:hypothetical protein